jgi:transposase-like protein
MKRTRHTTEQVIEKLRQADVALGKGAKVAEVCKTLGITEQTYYRWRQPRFLVHGAGAWRPTWRSSCVLSRRRTPD